jgi:hypothetical protein
MIEHPITHLHPKLPNSLPAGQIESPPDTPTRVGATVQESAPERDYTSHPHARGRYTKKEYGQSTDTLLQ